MSVTTPHENGRIDALIEAITQDGFDRWYRQRQVKQNMRDGHPWKHTPATTTPPKRHSPSRLLQCQRQTYYTAHNTPKEDPSPDGIFWSGSRIEEDLVQPYLESIADQVPQSTYVQNSMWVDYELETDTGPLRVKGATDPVLCTRDGDPLLPTEIKTKKSLEEFDTTDAEPNEQHKAQLHAYLRGLDASVSYPVQTGLIIYVSRRQHDLVAFRVEFDSTFWENRVREWAERQTQYRLEESLPPASPERDWECGYCAFRERCGQTEAPHEDLPAEGFVPQTLYPRQRVEQALQAVGGAETLTPTLAREYPQLADEHDVTDWRCPKCSECHPWESINWDGPPGSPPACPACTDGTHFIELECANEEVYRDGE